MAKRICTIEDCPNDVLAREWCTTHYHRWHRNGDPLIIGTRRETAVSRFERKVDKDGPIPDYRPDLGPCWLWSASTDGGGYGSFAVNGKKRLAHRWSYEYHLGPISEGFVIDHLCRVRACVNPAHLEPVTNHENVVARGVTSFSSVNARKTHCPKGHLLSGENLRVVLGSSQPGKRVCRACKLESGRRLREEKRSANLAG